MRFPSPNDPYHLSTRARRDPARHDPHARVVAVRRAFPAATPAPSIGSQTPAYAPVLIAPPNANKRIARRT
jgi:hypothetical protein